MSPIATASTLTVRPRSGLAGLFGRPLVLEARSPFERRALQRSPYWTGDGVPAGRGRPLLVIPGFLAGPRSTSALVRVLANAGWDVEIADVGRNSGPAYVGLASAEADLTRMAAGSAGPVTVIGHSRGGQFARILAVRYPELVTQIITLGTPISVKYPGFALVKVPAELLDRTWRTGAFGPVEPDREDAVDRDRHAAFPTDVGFVSVYSRTDGIVDWRASFDLAATMVEVSASHLGLINSVAGLEAVATALAQPGR